MSCCIEVLVIHLNLAHYGQPHPSSDKRTRTCTSRAERPHCDVTCDPTPPRRPQTPEGYIRYNPTDPNHVHYVRKIHLHREPYDTPQLPHYMRFEHNMGMHQHYTYGLMNDEDLHSTPYGWPIEAKPFMEPIPNLDVSVDNTALGIFDARYAKSLEVDASLYAVRDFGVLADVDKYCIKMLDYEDLLTQQAEVEKDLRRWRNTITPIRQRLVVSQAC